MRHNLKHERNDRGMTQKELAKKLNISERQYQRIESGVADGSFKMWDAMEDLFGVNQRILRMNSIAPKDNPQ